VPPSDLFLPREWAFKLGTVSADYPFQCQLDVMAIQEDDRVHKKILVEPGLFNGAHRELEHRVGIPLGRRTHRRLADKHYFPVAQIPAKKLVAFTGGGGASYPSKAIASIQQISPILLAA